MTVSGEVVHVSDERRISDKLTIREFVVKTNEEYPQEIIMQMANKKAQALNEVYEGDQVTAHINLRGRKGNNGRYFNTIECWKLEVNEN